MRRICPNQWTAHDRVAWVALAASLACACATTAGETAKGNWYEVRSPRFQLWTDGDPQQAQALVLDLERFHQVMLAKTTAEERSAAPPLRIFLAKDRDSFLAWTGMRKMAGMFAATYRGNYALLAGSAEREDEPEDGALDSRHVLFHEYTHYMMAANGARVPSWYNEGFAEYMATTKFRDDGSYTLGCPPRYRTRWLKYLHWLPIGRVMDSEDVAGLVRSVRTRREATDSYAQSWYAVHYLSADPARQSQLREYLRLWADGTEPAAAAERAFGMNYAQLDRLLQQYAAQPQLACVSIRPARPFASPRLDVRALLPAEAHYHVGDLMLAMFGPTDAAIGVLEDAAKLEPRSARAFAALARAHWQKAERAQDDWAPQLAEAERHLARARQRASADPEVFTLEGHVRRLSADKLEPRDAAAAVEQLALARAAYRKAIRADETLAEAYYGLGLTYLIEDTGSKEPEVVLEAAAYLLPLDPHVALAFAQLQMARGNALQAVPALEYVLRWSKNEQDRARVREKIAELQSAAAASGEPVASEANADAGRPDPEPAGASEHPARPGATR